MDPYVKLLLVGGAIVAGLGLLIWSGVRAENRRRDELRQVAEGLGFEFLPNGDPAFAQSLTGFALFSAGGGGRLSCLMRGTTRDLEAAIFGYTYITTYYEGNESKQRPHHHAVVGFRSGTAHLPAFALRPEGVLDKVTSWFGGQDIDFASHPTFSRQYLLRGPDVDAIRRLFTDRVLDYFEQHPNLYVEASGDRLLLYREGGLLEGPQVLPLLEEGYTLHSLLVADAGTSPART